MVKRRGYTPKRRNTRRRQMKRVLLLSVEGNKRNKTKRLIFNISMMGTWKCDLCREMKQILK